MSPGLIFALVCALAAIVYGVASIGWIMKKPAGNERMREIALAIQQGAQAYLNRQYTTIGIVGVILFVIIGVFLSWTTAGGFAVGGGARHRRRSHARGDRGRGRARSPRAVGTCRHAGHGRALRRADA